MIQWYNYSMVQWYNNTIMNLTILVLRTQYPEPKI